MRYSEEELISKVQSGELTMLDYVLNYSEDYRNGYLDFCRSQNLELSVETAEAYLSSREADMSESVTDN